MRLLLPLAGLVLALPATAAALRVPAFTAYSEPDPTTLHLGRNGGGVRDWSEAKQRVVWYGELKSTGSLHLALVVQLPATQTAKLALAVNQVGGDCLGTLEVAVEGTGQPVTVDLGSLTVRAAGYHRFELQALARSGATFGDVDALLLDGAAAERAHFNLKPRRNAASVHLGYPVAPGEQVAWFYSEVTARAEPVATYYEACGWHRGYFGMQVNSPTERRIIFSVWDAGDEPNDPHKTHPENRTQLLSKGENVVASAFGGEGTGGHSHLVYPWKVGETYRFLVTAEPTETTTTYTGWFWFAERQAWGLIARFKAPKDGSYLRGLYSFNENFWGDNGALRRLCEFGNQWVKRADGTWQELLTARFTHDATGKEDRHDYGAGVINGRFYLSNGGFVSDGITLGTTFTRPATGHAPEITLPTITG